ncbi:hypothetical protein DFQ28_007809 [Apophysomyces sp. BC1034]|nr:hypothetical protein DFQ30_000567 [Apophysomyces sp. BC1015]KAG0194663.1 hypothetical protein DFQ28_007809 [Apophysomyces sp. BC1034]
MAFTQYGCGGGGGGGGGGDVTSPVVEAQGLYIGTTSKNQTVFTWILDDGSLYALYASSDSSELDGVLAGNMKASGEALSSSDVIDYGLTNSETHKATISATYAPKGWLNGALAYPDVGGASVNFTTTYDTDYEKKPTLAAIAAARARHEEPSFLALLETRIQ